MISSSLEAVTTKIRALLALSKSSNIHEAAAAAAQAEALLQKHRLDEAALEGEAAPAESAEEASEPLAWRTSQLCWWQVRLGSVLVKSHGCAQCTTRRANRRCHIILGRPSDIATVRYLFAWLSAEIARLCELHEKGKGRTSRHSFCLDAVESIREAMNRAKADVARSATSRALVVLDGRDKEAATLLATLQPNLRRSKGTTARDYGAYVRGQEAGRSIHLGGALGPVPTTRMLGPG